MSIHVRSALIESTKQQDDINKSDEEEDESDEDEEYSFVVESDGYGPPHSEE